MLAITKNQIHASWKPHWLIDVTEETSSLPVTTEQPPASTEQPAHAPTSLFTSLPAPDLSGRVTAPAAFPNAQRKVEPSDDRQKSVLTREDAEMTLVLYQGFQEFTLDEDCFSADPQAQPSAQAIPRLTMPPVSTTPAVLERSRVQTRPVKASAGLSSRAQAAAKPVVSPSRAQELPVPLEITTAKLEILCLKLVIGELTPQACLMQAVGLFTTHRQGSEDLEQSKNTCLAKIDYHLEGNAEMRDKMRALCNHIFSAPAVKK